MRRVLLVTAALAAAVAVWIVLARPPRAAVLDSSWDDGSIAGLLHIHSKRSDGRGDLDEIAAAAAAAGLRFIVVTDHGDGTRPPEPPAYRSGVLVLDAVEISTTGGHYLAFGMKTAPYPLGGEPRDVVEDVRRLGGFGVVAHPDSPKASLAWQGWSLPIDGLEILNPDSGWRSHAFDNGLTGKFKLLTALATYPSRPSETIGELLTNSTRARQRWDTLTSERPIIGLAGVDAHARLELSASDPDTERFALPIPGYEPSFRTLSVHVLPHEPLSGDAELDGRRVLDAIKAARLYVAVDAWATPPRFQFEAIGGGGHTEQGGTLAPGDDLVLKLRHNGPAHFTTTILEDGQSFRTHVEGNSTSVSVEGREGTYRAEVRDPAHPEGPPWITSNPIYVRVWPAPPPPAPSAPQSIVGTLFDGTTANGWTIESDVVSKSAIDVAQLASGTALHLRYGLASGADTGQFAGVAVATPQGVSSAERVSFGIRADRPMRVSIQVRGSVPGALPERWQRSIYVDQTSHEQWVRFDDMTPVGTTRTPAPQLDRIEAILLIVDTTNTAPGQSGHLWLTDVRLERTAAVR